MAGPEETQGEHTFEIDILISGEEIRSYAASEELIRAEPVEIDGNYTVSASTGDAFAGLTGYSVAEGKQVPVIGDDCEVRLELGGGVSAGDGLTADGTGSFVAAGDGDTQHAVANSDGSTGDHISAYVTTTEGNEVI